MGKKEVYTQKVLFVTKCMLAAYILTAGLLLLLAFMLYRFGLSEKVVSLCIIGIYIAVTFLTGVLSGRPQKVSVGSGYGRRLLCDPCDRVADRQQGAAGRGRQYGDGVFPLRGQRYAGRHDQLNKNFYENTFIPINIVIYYMKLSEQLRNPYQDDT